MLHRQYETEQDGIGGAVSHRRTCLYLHRGRDVMTRHRRKVKPQPARKVPPPEPSAPEKPICHYAQGDAVTMREWFKETLAWKHFLIIHGIRVRLRWVLVLLLLIAILLFALGVEVMGHISFCMAIEQLLYHTGLRVVSAVEDSA